MKALALLLLLTACSSSPVQPGQAPPAVAPASYDPPAVKALTTAGDNTQPRFHADGERLLFVGRNRPPHTQAQIYELHLSTAATRRVTFQDGDATDPDYLPSGEGLIYASTTDEIKEDPQFVAQLLERYTNAKPTVSPALATQELYLSKLDGSFIKRITLSPGFDGMPAPHPRGLRIVFASNRSGPLELFQLTGENLILSKLSKIRSPAGQPRFSADGKHLSWIEAQGPASQIYVGGEWGQPARALPLPRARYQDVSLASDGTRVLFSSDLAGNYEIYHFDLNAKCLQRLTFDNSIDITPVFRPGDKQIVFASNRSGSFQLYLMDFKPPKDCLPL